MLKVKYINVGGSGDRCHEFLEWCRREGVGIHLWERQLLIGEEG